MAPSMVSHFLKAENPYFLYLVWVLRRSLENWRGSNFNFFFFKKSLELFHDTLGRLMQFEDLHLRLAHLYVV